MFFEFTHEKTQNLFPFSFVAVLLIIKMITTFCDGFFKITAILKIAARLKKYFEKKKSFVRPRLYHPGRLELVLRPFRNARYPNSFVRYRGNDKHRHIHKTNGRIGFLRYNLKLNTLNAIYRSSQKSS